MIASALTHPLAETVGWALLHSLWQGALVALLFALGLAVLGRPQHRYLLGCASMLLMLILPVGTGVLLYEPPSTPSAPLLEPDATISAPLNSTSSVEPAPLVLTTPSSPSLESTLNLPAYLTRDLQTSLQTGAPWLAAFWLFGVVLLLLRLFGGALYAARFRARHRTPAPELWQLKLRALAKRLGLRAAPMLAQSEWVDTPLTLGVLRPLIVIPSSALTGVPAAQLEAVLVHELAHIRRRDYLVNLLQCVLETLMFYHPAVWWVSSEVRRAREECCDDLAVAVCGDARLYARALVSLETLRCDRPAFALAATDKPLLARIRRLLGMEANVRFFPSLTTALLIIALLVAGVLVTLQPVVAQDASPTQAQPSTPQEVAENKTSITGVVSWNNTPLAGVRVELQSRLESIDAERCCKEPQVFQTTTTNETGEYSLEGIDPGGYTVWAFAPSEEYPQIGYDVEAVRGFSMREDIRLHKQIEGFEPDATDGVSLTPTLTWRPLPGAARYEVELNDAQSGEPLIPPYRNLEEPRLAVEEPLEKNTIYRWSVVAYAEDGTRIAYGESSFSTSPAKASVPIELTALGARTVLPEDWQQVSPGVFEQASETGARRTLTFEKVPGDDPEAVLRARSTSSSGVVSQSFGGDTWWAQIDAGDNGPDHVQATARGGSVYLITVETEDEFPVELYSFVLPLVSQNFEVTE